MRSSPPGLTTWLRPALLLLLAAPFAAGCQPSKVSGNGNCGDLFECEPGQLCVDGECKTVCGSDADCSPAEACEDGFCQPADAGECSGAIDCVEPGLCETTAGATCLGGLCRYPIVDGGPCTDNDNCSVNDHCTATAECVSEPVTCAQSAPFNVCLSLVGSCDPLVDGGACEGAACCVFSQAWPEGSPDPQPSCPFSGEDGNNDGIEGGGETWSGVCNHDGRCVGCTGNAQCDDNFACTGDSCDLGVCYNNPISDGSCTVGPGVAGRCVVQGAAVTCLPAPGEACIDGTDCASGVCVCADDGCTNRVCHESGCATCHWDGDGIGSCQPTGVGNFGESCTTSGFACGTSGGCLLANGQSCAQNGDCASGHCECSGPDCAPTSMICSAVDCDCKYNSDGDAVCDGPLTFGLEDPDNTCGGSGCDGSGNCAGEAGVPCSFDNECASLHCADGYCCDSACGGNCDRCDQPGSVGTCISVDTLCTGNCDICNTSGSCEAVPSSCTGNCDVCTGSGTTFSCTPDDPVCTGSCSACIGSGTNYTCQANNAACTGNCSSCSGIGTDFNCGPDETVCTGNCDACSGSGTTYSCAADSNACTGNCDLCTGSGTSFSCAPNAGDCLGNCDECTGAGNSYSCTGNALLCSGTCVTCNGGGNNYSCAPNAAACSGDCSICSGGGSAYNCAPNSADCPGSCEECTGSGIAYSCSLLADGDPGNPACTPGLCDGVNPSCPSGCATDVDCVGGTYCCSGTCAPDEVDACSGGINAIGPLAEGQSAISPLRFMGGSGTVHWYNITFPHVPSEQDRGTGVPSVTFVRNDGNAFQFDVYAPDCSTLSDPLLMSWDFWDTCEDTAGTAWTTTGVTHGCKTRNVPWPTDVWVRVSRTAPGGACQGYQLDVTRPPAP